MTRLPKHHRLPARALWRPAHRISAAARPPASLMPWLMHSGSLTQRLQRHFSDDLNLKVLGQRWVRPSVNEARLLDIGPRHLCLERRVALIGAGETVVLGRSLMPGHCLNGPYRRLAHLGSRPLGAVLFSDSRAHRKSLELAQLPPGHAPFPTLQSEAWGRRSVFELTDKPLLVYEVFIDDLEAPPARPELDVRAA